MKNGRALEVSAEMVVVQLVARGLVGQFPITVNQDLRFQTGLKALIICHDTVAQYVLSNQYDKKHHL
jgi:hypothetical protein